MSGYDLKSEEEVKLYLDNLGIEYRFSCYHEKRPDGCHLLGDYLEAIKKQYDKALKVYQLNCDVYNHSKSCYKYASYRLLGRGRQIAHRMLYTRSRKDDATAFRYFVTGCRADNAKSCLLAGVIATSNASSDEQEAALATVGGRDYVQGMAYLRKSCLADNAEACHAASTLNINGHDRMPRDMKKAFEYATRACRLGNAYSCSNLSQMYRKGEGTEKNEVLAERFKKMAIHIQEQHAKEFQQIRFGE